MRGGSISCPKQIGDFALQTCIVRRVSFSELAHDADKSGQAECYRSLNGVESEDFKFLFNFLTALMP